jgi:hypothetical protein
VSIHQARTALKLRKATEYPVDAKDDSDQGDEYTRPDTRPMALILEEKHSPLQLSHKT